MDVHYMFPDIPVSLSRVGVRSVKVMVKTKRRSVLNVLFPKMDIYIDLPASMKGVNLSRSIEGVKEVLKDVEKKPIRFIEDFCSKIARRLLKKHEYASRSEVRFAADYFIPRSPYDSSHLFDERYKIYALALARKRNGKIKVKKFVGASVIGLTVCPCAMDVISKKIKYKLIDGLNLEEKLSDEILMNIPIPSHNQRCLVKTLINSTRKNRINLDDIISVMERSVSAPTFSILKKSDEANVLIDAHKNPRFAEDVVRNVIRSIIERYPNLPGDTFIHVKCISFESIHKYNLIAEKAGKLEVLKRQISTRILGYCSTLS